MHTLLCRLALLSSLFTLATSLPSFSTPLSITTNIQSPHSSKQTEFHPHDIPHQTHRRNLIPITTSNTSSHITHYSWQPIIPSENAQLDILLAVEAMRDATTTSNLSPSNITYPHRIKVTYGNVSMTVTSYDPPSARLPDDYTGLEGWPQDFGSFLILVWEEMIQGFKRGDVGFGSFGVTVKGLASASGFLWTVLCILTLGEWQMDGVHHIIGR